MCECEYGFVLNGEACEAQGTQIYQEFWIISKSVDVWKKVKLVLKKLRITLFKLK